jgi:NodT family efflux transporter outer membrane factor (OMF) lipoprotein
VTDGAGTSWADFVRCRDLSLVSLLLVLGGCAVGPNFAKPEAQVAAAWSVGADQHFATQTTADVRWWKAFNDPALDRLVDLAYRQNLPLQVAGLRIAGARAQLGIATGKQFPQLQVAVGSATAVGISQNTPNLTFPGFSHRFGDYQVGFDAAWELDFWGKYRRGVESEAAGLLATVADYYAAIVSVTAEVARTYVTIRTFEVLIELARANAKVQEEGLDIAQSRFRNGATSELDPTQATTLLESTRATIPQLQIGLQQARNALCTLLGQPTGTVDALLVGPAEIPRAPATVAIGVPAEMLRRRPDVRSAELAAAAQCARIGVAKADLYPSFSILGTFGLETSTVNGKTPNLFSSNSIFYTIGPRINWSFFNYGRLENAVRVQDALFQQSLVSYRDTVLKAAQEVEDALAGFVNSQDALVFETKAATSAEKSVSLSLVAYREGATDFQRVLDAQRSLLQQQNSLAQTSSDVVTDLIALYKALGGGWESRQGQPFIPEQTQQQMKERTNWDEMLSEPAAPETPQNPQAGAP